MVDLDLNLEDFVARVNADLVGKFVNIASRCAGFIGKRFGGVLAPALADPALYARFAAARNEVMAAYAGDDFARARTWAEESLGLRRITSTATQRGVLRLARLAAAAAALAETSFTSGRTVASPSATR